MDNRGQEASDVKASFATSISDEQKTEISLLKQLESLLRQSRDGFKQERVYQRARNLSLSALVCLGRHTVTGLVSTGGRQFVDWSADYRLFGQERFDADYLFQVVRRGIIENLAEDSPLVVAMDDSILRKSGPRMAGVSYRRDPLSPPFHVNFIRGQRVLQLSAASPAAGTRMIPIDFKHTPTPKKPGYDASPEVWQEYKQALKDTNISRRGVARIRTLRHQLDADPGGHGRSLRILVDGRFTNATVLKNFPQSTVLIGRVRKDTKFYYLPDASEDSPLGRRRVYGDRAPTPRQLQQDLSVAWKTINVWAAGKRHAFKIKSLAPLRWRPAGANHDLRLIVIAPLAYRPRKGSRLLYRKPAYLISTDTNLSLQEIVQEYVWRWDIEVNFRDEKNLLGVGQPQVRTPSSVEKVPELIVATYAMLLLAAHQTSAAGQSITDFPAPAKIPYFACKPDVDIRPAQTREIREKTIRVPIKNNKTNPPQN
jgi:hypothetical protein